MIACVLKTGGLYTGAHVQALRRQCSEHASWKSFVCLTDVFVPEIACLPLRHNWPGWWSKLELFRPDVFPVGTRVLYLDLDTVIVGHLGEILTQDAPFLALEDFYRRPPKFTRGVGSGVMQWTAGDQDELYFAMADAPDEIRKTYRSSGDQRFIEARRKDSVTFWPDVVPGQIVSYKAHCPGGVVPEGARVVCFHGTPKPWNVPALRVTAHA